MAQPWHDLPNAVHIDRILEDVRARPDAWTKARAAAGEEVKYGARAAWAAARAAAGDEVWDTMWVAVRDAAWDSAWDAARAAVGVAWDEVWRTVWTWTPAARDPILALIAWPDSAYLLDTDPEQVRLLGLLGHQPAILLYFACCALSKSSTKSMTYST